MNPGAFEAVFRWIGIGAAFLAFLSGIGVWIFGNKARMLERKRTDTEIARVEETAQNNVDLVKKEAEKELKKIRSKFVWRAISQEQEAIISKALQGTGGETVNIFAIVGSEEVDKYAKSLASVLTKNGLRVSFAPMMAFGVAKSGITFENGNSRMEFAETIGNAFISAGLIKAPITAQKSQDPKQFAITIWPREE